MSQRTIPRWANLSPEQVSEIQSALIQAESKTSGEIVPMMVRRSSPVDFLPHILFCWILITWLFLAPSLWKEILWPWLVLLGGGMILAQFLARRTWIQRWLTRWLGRENHVMTRAKLEFYEFSVNHTAGATGILIMASMMEHEVVVLADEGISSKLPPETWQGVCDLLVDGIKKGQVTAGFTEAIERCGELLQTHFPKNSADANELSDHFIIKD